MQYSFARTAQWLGILVLPIALCTIASADWTPVEADFNRAIVLSAAIAPSDPSRLYAVTAGGGISGSNNAGADWTLLAIPTLLGASGSPRNIAVSPHDADLVLAGTIPPLPADAEVLRSTDGGATWTVIESGLGGSWSDNLTFDPVTPATVYVGTSAGLTDGVYKSTDFGLTWIQSTASLGDVAIYSLSLNPSDPSMILAGTLSGAIRSTDAGASWSTVPGAPDYFKIAWSTSPQVVYGWTSTAIYRSTDAGISFAPLVIPDGGLAPSFVEPHPDDADEVYLGLRIACPNGNTSTGAVYRSEDGGDTWTNVFLSPDCAEFPRDLLFDPTDSSQLYVTTMGPEGLYHSTDGGDSWDRRNQGFMGYEVSAIESDGAGNALARGADVSMRTNDTFSTWEGLPALPGAYMNDLEVNRQAPGLAYECGEAESDHLPVPYLVASTDFGDSWTPEIGEFPAGFPGATAIGIASAWNDSRVYVFAYSDVYRSDNGGNIYSNVHSGIRFDKGAVDPGNPDRLFATGHGVNSMYISEDAGGTWTPRNNGLPLGMVIHLEVNPTDGNHVSVTYQNTGAWESTDAGLTWSRVFDATDPIHYADWNPATGHYYFAVRDQGVISNDPRLAEMNWPVGIGPICYDDASDALISGAGWLGMYALQLLDPASTPEGSTQSTSWASVQAIPNPTNGPVRVQIEFAAAEDADHAQSLEVYDSAGRRVRQLKAGGFEPTSTQFKWDGTDASGRDVPSGVYWIRLLGEEKQAEAKVSILR